jgi:hypothetical protein
MIGAARGAVTAEIFCTFVSTRSSATNRPLSRSTTRTPQVRLSFASRSVIGMRLARSAESSDNRVSPPDALAMGQIPLAGTPAGEPLKAGRATQRCHTHTITDEDKKQPAAENLTRIGRKMAESLKLVRRADGKIAL